MSDKRKYFECICYDKDHALRLWVDSEESEILLEFNVHKIGSKSNKKRSWSEWGIIRNYFTNLWWAIKGNPSWFQGDICLGKKESKKLGTFLLKESKKMKF